MQMNNKSISVRGVWVGLALAAAALLGGCASQAVKLSEELPFDQAVAKATDGLVAQTQKLPGFLAKVDLLSKAESKLGKRSVALDPMIDASSGQQTGATQMLERKVTERMTARSDLVEILAFQSANLSKAQYLLTGTLVRDKGTHAGQGRGPLQINLALTELKSGNVVAQASAVARDEGLDHTPLRYYQDSPVLVKDKVVDGYVRTSAMPPGQPADNYYFERIAVATVIVDANAAYNAERYQEALSKYRAAGGMTGGDQLRTLNGIYLANTKLGRVAEAEAAFGNIVAYGFRFSQLDVKFLFNPGSTVFWSDPKVSSAYGMWLRQIAKEGNAAKVCMNIVGHTSKTGSDGANDALSLQRANAIQQRLASEAGTLAARVKTSGMGFRENIIGSGSDNAVDALDRRVEFKIVGC
jgi:outer membrane protein OmpA-like peptidoglycan-associated protein